MPGESTGRAPRTLCASARRERNEMVLPLCFTQNCRREKVPAWTSVGIREYQKDKRFGGEAHPEKESCHNQLCRHTAEQSKHTASEKQVCYHAPGAMQHILNPGVRFGRPACAALRAVSWIVRRSLHPLSIFCSGKQMVGTQHFRRLPVCRHYSIIAWKNWPALR